MTGRILDPALDLAVGVALQIAAFLGSGPRVAAIVPDSWDRHVSTKWPERTGAFDFII